MSEVKQKGIVLSIKDEESQDHECKETNPLKIKIKEKNIFFE